MVPDVAFDLDLAHGRCVGVRIPEAGPALEALAETLAPEERARGDAFPPARRRTWIAGRAAMREALTRSGLAAPPVLADDRGAPTLPAGTTGSISHKDDLAVALVGRALGRHVGVDVERDRPSRVDLTRRVLTAAEVAELPGDDLERGRRVLVAFSAKEAVYKAIDPLLRRYVGFHEVALGFGPDGTATVALALADAPEGLTVDVTWTILGGFVLATAMAVRQRST